MDDHANRGIQNNAPQARRAPTPEISACMPPRCENAFCNLFRGAVLIVLGSLIACADPTIPSHQDVHTIVVGVLPDRSRDVLLEKYTPLISYLQTTTGLDIELVFHDDYEQLQSAFEDREIHLAWFGGLTFVRVSLSAGAEPLVMRDTDFRFTSYYLVRADSKWASLRELRGKRFAFGPRLSTSGHLMPRYFLKAEGIAPEHYFGEVRYSAAHDETARLVSDGVVDAGVANGTIIDTMYANGDLSEEQVRVIESTPPFHNYVWAVQPDLPDEIRLALLDAFLALDMTDPEYAPVLHAQGAQLYMPASDADFDSIMTVARSQGLLTPEATD